MKNIIVSIILMVLACNIFAQDKIVYIKKEDINAKQLAEWQKNGQIIDQFVTYTDISLTEKIENLRKNWSRDAMEDLLQDFSISPEQFGIVVDSLSNVVIRQSNDIPNTSVGRITLAGFAWKIAGPSIFRFVVDVLFVIFFLIFFIWSYKRNFWKTIFVLKKEAKPFGKILEKKKFSLDTLFTDDSWLSGDSGFDSDIVASKFMHIVAFCLLIIMSIFLL